MRLALALILLCLAAAVARPALANGVEDMRVVGDSSRTRFVVDLEKTPQYKVLRLANPYRLVIDMPDVAFRDPTTAPKGRGLVSDYRYGLIGPGKARIVLDLTGPAEVLNTFVLDPVGPEPARLVIDLTPTDTKAYDDAVALDAPARARAAAARQEAQEDAPSATSGKPVVVIDPGHGGIDSGAVGDGGLLEKDIVLAFAKELAQVLKEDGRLEPVLTRDDDTYLSLSERVAFGRRHHARLFVSIHADTVRQDYVRGATVYTLSDDASDEMAATLADQENRSDILAGLAIEDQPDDVADILFDLAMRETRNLSVRFAKELVTDMKGAMALNSNPWRRAAFKVLKAPEVPSVLLELGYLSSPEDEKLFQSDAWPAGEAKAVARSIEAFFGEFTAAGQ